MNQWRVSLRYEITPPDDLQPALRKSATNDLAACVQGRDKRPAPLMSGPQMISSISGYQSDGSLSLASFAHSIPGLDPPSTTTLVRH